MPYSNVEQITPIMQEIVKRQPKSMLDAGCGLGIYGMLTRVQLDLYFDDLFYLKLFREHRTDKRWKGVRIDAIEGFQDYIDYIPDWVYDTIIVEDVRTALPKIPDGQYDIALALAIIEHLDKKDGTEFLLQLQRVSKVLILSVPKNVSPQHAPGNDFETHRSQWSKEDLINLGAKRFIPHWGAWIAVFDPDESLQQDTDEVPVEVSVQKAPLHELDNSILTKLDQILDLQQTTLKSLGLRYRLKLFWKRLTGGA